MIVAVFLIVSIVIVVIDCLIVAFILIVLIVIIVIECLIVAFCYSHLSVDCFVASNDRSFVRSLVPFDRKAFSCCRCCSSLLRRIRTPRKLALIQRIRWCWSGEFAGYLLFVNDARNSPEIF
jgi:hypothetical protein